MKLLFFTSSLVFPNNQKMNINLFKCKNIKIVTNLKNIPTSLWKTKLLIIADSYTSYLSQNLARRIKRVSIYRALRSTYRHYATTVGFSIVAIWSLLPLAAFPEIFIRRPSILHVFSSSVLWWLDPYRVSDLLLGKFYFCRCVLKLHQLSY